MIDTLSDRQLDFIVNSDARVNLAVGAVRSGKTFSSIVRFLEFMETAPPGNIAIIGKTFRTVRRNVLSEIENIVGETHFDYNRGLGEVEIYGRQVLVSSANNRRSEEKIRGNTYAGAYCDEVSIYPENFWNMLLSRLSVPGAKLFGTLNPAGPYHWLKTDFIDRDELDQKVFKFELDDNPALSEKYKESLRQEYQGVWYRRYIEGVWAKAEGLVYENFDPSTHIVTNLPDIRKYFVGVDYGTSNATAFILLGYGTDGNLYVIDEYRHEGGEGMTQSKTDLEYAEDFLRWLGDIKAKWIAVDPSAKSFRLALYRKRKENRTLSHVITADNAVIDGIRNISSLLSSEQLFIHSRCKHTRKEFQSYSWDSKAQARGEDKPLKESDHCLDALRYAVQATDSVLRKLLSVA